MAHFHNGYPININGSKMYHRDMQERQEIIEILKELIKNGKIKFIESQAPDEPQDL